MERSKEVLGKRVSHPLQDTQAAERALARTSENAVPFRACFLFDNSPNLYNWNVKWGFSQGTGWELMDQSVLPHQCFYRWLLECVWWKESDFFRQKILMWPAEVRTCRNNTPMLSGLCLPPTPFQNWQQERKHFLKPLLSVVRIINSHMLCLSLGGM